MCSIIQKTQTSEGSDEEVAGAEAAPAKRFKSTNGEIFGSSVPHDVHNRAATANVIKMSPGATRFAVTRVSDVKEHKLFLGDFK